MQGSGLSCLETAAGDERLESLSERVGCAVDGCTWRAAQRRHPLCVEERERPREMKDKDESGEKCKYNEEQDGRDRELHRRPGARSTSRDRPGTRGTL